MQMRTTHGMGGVCPGWPTTANPSCRHAILSTPAQSPNSGETAVDYVTDMMFPDSHQNTCLTSSRVSWVTCTACVHRSMTGYNDALRAHLHVHCWSATRCKWCCIRAEVRTSCILGRIVRRGATLFMMRNMCDHAFATLPCTTRPTNNTPAGSGKPAQNGRCAARFTTVLAPILKPASISGSCWLPACCW